MRKTSVLDIKQIIGPRPLGEARAGCAPPGSASDNAIIVYNKIMFSMIDIGLK